MEPDASGLPAPGHQGNAIGRPMPGLGSAGLGHRIEELFATGWSFSGTLGAFFLDPCSGVIGDPWGIFRNPWAFLGFLGQGTGRRGFAK